MSARGRTSIFVLLLCLVSLPAVSASTGFYAGIAVGLSKFDSNDSLFISAWPIRSTTREWSDNLAFAWSASAGYEINRFVGIEMNYYDFGTAKFREINTTTDRLAPFVTDTLSGEAHAHGPAIGLIASLPVSNWKFSAEAKALYAMVTLDGPVARSSVGPLSSIPFLSSFEFHESKSSTRVLYGARVEYLFPVHYAIGIDWHLATHTGEQNHLGGIDLRLLSLGLKYRF